MSQTVLSLLFPPCQVRQAALYFSADIGKQQDPRVFLLDYTVMLLNSVPFGHKLTSYKHKHPHVPSPGFLYYWHYWYFKVK